MTSVTRPRPARTRALVRAGLLISAWLLAAPAVRAAVTLGPSSGPPGTRVLASWAPPEPTACAQIVPPPLQVWWDGSVLLAEDASRGSPCSPYAVPFDVPLNAAPGEHIVDIRDAWGVAETATFTVTGSSSSAPAAPSNLRVSAPSRAQVDLEWADNSTNEDEFSIDNGVRCVAAPCHGSLVAQVGPNVTSHTFHLSEPVGDELLCFTVQAINAAGVSGASNRACADQDAER